jgi:hypothetical protein
MLSKSTINPVEEPWWFCHRPLLIRGAGDMLAPHRTSASVGFDPANRTSTIRKARLFANE